ncbi:MAG: T9SS type A sorting domain-containing protein [Bacteroidia bacterium]
MKKLLLSALSLILLPSAFYAQQIENSAPNPRQAVPEEAVRAVKSALGLSAGRSLETIYVDYPVADEIDQGVGTSSNFLWTFNSYYTAADTPATTIDYVGVRIRDLIGYADPNQEPIETYSGPYAYPNDLTITIDSVFMLFSHENNSGMPDTIIMEIRDQNAQGNLIPNGTLRWADSTITESTFTVTSDTVETQVIDEITTDTIPTNPVEIITSDTIYTDTTNTEISEIINDTMVVFQDTMYVSDTTYTTVEEIINDTTYTGQSLSSGGNWVGQGALASLSLGVGYKTTPNQKVGFTVRYLADKRDTMGILASYVPNPDGPTAPDDIALKSLYPNSFFRWQGVLNSGVYATSSIFYNPQPGQDTGYFYAQNWQIWALVTFENVTGVKQSMKIPLGLNQNMPNPFSDNSRINYAIKDAQNLSLSIYDINGRLINTQNLGYKTAGEYSTMVNASELSAGTYFYQINGEKSKSEMKKMIVIH